jgi:hypothetical protein
MLPNCLAFDILPVKPASDLNQVQLFRPKAPFYASLTGTWNLIRAYFLPSLFVPQTNMSRKILQP